MEITVLIYLAIIGAVGFALYILFQKISKINVQVQNLMAIQHHGILVDDDNAEKRKMHEYPSVQESWRVERPLGPLGPLDSLNDEEEPEDNDTRDVTEDVFVTNEINYKECETVESDSENSKPKIIIKKRE